MYMGAPANNDYVEDRAEGAQQLPHLLRAGVAAAEHELKVQVAAPERPQPTASIRTRLGVFLLMVC